MNGPRTGTPMAAEDIAAAWQRCWEILMRLPTKTLSGEALFAEAKRAVRTCRMHTGDKGIDWFREELDEGRVFVAEQIAVDPDPDWRRLQTVLEGACFGLEAC